MTWRIGERWNAATQADRRDDRRDGERRDRTGRNRGEDKMTRLTLTAMPNRCGSPTHTVSAAIALGVALAAAPSAALADAQVRGSREAVTVEAKNTSVEDVLKALSGAFDVHYRSSVNLQTHLTGSYAGSLQTVMKRVLDGYSYFVKIGDGRIDLTVLDAPQNAPSIGASDLVRVVAPAEGARAQPSPAIATVQPSVMAVPAAPSTAASSSGGVGPLPSAPPQTEEGRVGAAAPPSPAIAGVDPPAQPAPSSRRRDNLAIAGGKESQPLPPRRIKIASGSGHWKKGRHHARRTRLAKSNVLCRRPVSWFGLPLMIPVSSSYWFHSEPLYVRPVPTCTLRQYGRLK
jgi:hypothetical protein